MLLYTADIIAYFLLIEWSDVINCVNELLLAKGKITKKSNYKDQLSIFLKPLCYWYHFFSLGFDSKNN